MVHVNPLESVNPETRTDKKAKLERIDFKGFRSTVQTSLEK